MSRKWVINASPPIILGKVAGIPLLNKLCSDLVIPVGVAQELDQGLVNDPARNWINGEGVSPIDRNNRGDGR